MHSTRGRQPTSRCPSVYHPAAVRIASPTRVWRVVVREEVPELVSFWWRWLLHKRQVSKAKAEEGCSAS